MLRDFFLIAQPPLLGEEGKTPPATVMMRHVFVPCLIQAENGQSYLGQQCA
jgi:hypothetical protein